LSTTQRRGDHRGESEFRRTYAARDRALFISAQSGFRISELLSLRVGMYSSMTASWTRSRATAHMKQRTEGRTVPLHPEAKQALAAWIDALRDGGRCSATPICFGVGRRQSSDHRIQPGRS